MGRVDTNMAMGNRIHYPIHRKINKMVQLIENSAKFPLINLILHIYLLLLLLLLLLIIYLLVRLFDNEKMNRNKSSNFERVEIELGRVPVSVLLLKYLFIHYQNMRKHLKFLILCNFIIIIIIIIIIILMITNHNKINTYA